MLEYFIKGSSHFFNLFADFLEHCENIIYFLFLMILLILIFFTLKKDNNFKSTLWSVIKSYFILFKYSLFTLLCLILLICSIITFRINNQFRILSILVLVINFIKETVTAYDDKLFNQDNSCILNIKDFKNILASNLVLVFFKITYWSELYIFNINEIKNYFIIMLIIIIIEIVVMIIFKIYSIYSGVFKYVKSKSDYNLLIRIIDLMKVLKICNNNINYFNLIRIFLQCEIVTKKNHKEIINFCLYYKAIKNKIKKEDYRYNYDIYNDFISVYKRIGCDKNE